MGIPYFLSHTWTKYLVIGIISLLAIFEEAYYLNHLGYDPKTFMIPWVNLIRLFGVWDVYAYTFSDYAPLYTYLLGISVLFPNVEPLYIIKYISLAGNAIATFYTWRILRLFYLKDSFVPLAAAVGLWTLPSVVINGAAVGQCDVFYSAFLLASLYALMQRRALACLVFFGIAFSFKLQAVFFSPLLLMALLQRVIPWRLIWVPAAVYCVSIIPAWLEGRPLIELLGVYYGQFNSHHNLVGAANFYYLFKSQDYYWVLYNGLCISILVALGFAVAGARQLRDEVNPYACLLLATIILVLMPFLLPKMYSRYFFTAQLLIFVLACVRPQVWPIVLMLQFSAVCSIEVGNFPYFARWSKWPGSIRHQLSAFVTLASIAGLFLFYYRDIIRGKVVVSV